MPPKRNCLRIIGGQWRGRKLSFPDIADLRPTPDRVRETLFNWLQQDISGARCLDLFAGSGALGLEALSRGAAHVTFVDSHTAAIRRLCEHLSTLNATHQTLLIAGNAEHYLRRQATAFDIVFIDPPYQHHHLYSLCHTLETNGWLHHAAWIYIENAATDTVPELPETWTIARRKEAGGVRYQLARRSMTTQS